jgi:hypothetical protein
MKKLLFIVITIGVIFTYKQNTAKASAKGSSNKTQNLVSSDKVVFIEYTDENDLLSKLRTVKAGQQLNLRDISSSAPVNTGLYCSDKAAIANLEAQDKARLAQINRQLKAEFDRINNVH